MEEAAIYNSIDDKFSYTFRRKFINILPVNALYPCAKMNISKNELIRLLYLIPEITSVLSFIYKNTTCISFKNCTLYLRHNTIKTSQIIICIRWTNNSIFFLKNSPGYQVILGRSLNLFSVFLVHTITLCLFFHVLTKAFNICICYFNVFIHNIIKGSILILIVHFLDKWSVSKPRRTSCTDKSTLIHSKRFKIIRSLPSCTNFYHNNHLSPTACGAISGIINGSQLSLIALVILSIMVKTAV